MTQVEKQYGAPFLVEPTKLGRIVDVIHQRLAEHANTAAHDSFDVFFAGNRRVVAETLDEVLSLDNSRRSRVTRLLIVCTASASGAHRPEHEVSADFAVEKTTSDGGTTKIVKVVEIRVRSDVAGWASRTLSEVEEQVERTWLPPPRAAGLVALLGLIVLALLMAQFITPSRDLHSGNMWLSADNMTSIRAFLTIDHPISESELREVVTMQLRNLAAATAPPVSDPSPRTSSLWFLIGPLLVILGCIAVLVRTCYPRAVFLRGDEVERYHNALHLRRTLWGIIVGIAIVGVASKFLVQGMAGWFGIS